MLHSVWSQFAIYIAPVYGSPFGKYKDQPGDKISENDNTAYPYLRAVNYWLIKSEPHKYSWDQFVKDKKTTWDGVRNYTARINLRAMQIGDWCFFYHSNEGMEIVGIAEVSKEAYQDPSTEDDRWVAVDVKPVQKLNRPVTLAEMKADKRLEGFELIRISRLSVAKVTKKEFDTILSLSEK